MASQSKIKAARERYEALLATTQQELDVLKERQAALTEHMSEVKGRLEDIQLALDAFTAAPEQEESAPEQPPAPEPPASPEPQEASPAATRERRSDLRGLDVIDAALLLAKHRRRREVNAATVTGWLSRAGYRNRQNKVATQSAVSNALVREHNLGEGNVIRVAQGVYRLNW